MRFNNFSINNYLDLDFNISIQRISGKNTNEKGKKKKKGRTSKSDNTYNLILVQIISLYRSAICLIKAPNNPHPIFFRQPLKSWGVKKEEKRML